MSNSKIDSYYSKLAFNATDCQVTRNKAKDSSELDCALVARYAGENKTLLDLGSGTGLLVNGLDGKFDKITAVEKYPEFSKFINSSDRLEVKCQDILDPWQVKGTFDVVTFFGVLNFFNKKETLSLYKKARLFLANDGTLVVKNQFGVNDDVIVDGFSEELNTNYYSEYRHVNSEQKLISVAGLKLVDKVDIYPPSFNRWDNTHFYALICKIND